MSRETSKKSTDAGRHERTERRHSSVGRRWTDKLLNPVRKHAEEISAGPLTICDQNKKAFVDGKDAHLAPLEYELLRMLAARRGQVVSSDELAEKLWGHKRIADPEETKKYIYRLRNKIEPDPGAPRCTCE